MTRVAWLAAATAAFLALSTAGAAAQPADPPHVVEAREHLGRGTQMLDQENYDGALAEFERAYQLVGEHPFRYLILFNIARAHERRFRYDLALEYYQRYLDEGGPEAEHRAEVQATMRTLEGLLATLNVQSNIPAEVWVDDRRVGDAPGEVRITSGRHVVELRARGYVDSRQEVQIAARETQSLAFELSELAGEFRGIDSAYFFGATALAAVTAIVGAGFGIAAIVRSGDVEAQLRDPIEGLDASSIQAANDEIATYALVADVLYGTAGLFAATAVVLAFLTDFGGAPEEGATALLPAVGPGSAGLVLRGAF